MTNYLTRWALLHGVGAPYVTRMFEEFALPPFIPVESQMAPDPEFSTVVFPNPEEGRSTWAESFKTATAAVGRCKLTPA
jgi:phosphomannomutase